MTSFLQRSSQFEHFGSPQVRRSIDFNFKTSPSNSNDVLSQLFNARSETIRRAENSERSQLLSLESPLLNSGQKKQRLNFGQSVPSSTKHSSSEIFPFSSTSQQIQQLSPKKSFIFHENNNTSNNLSVSLAQPRSNLQISKLSLGQSNISLRNSINAEGHSFLKTGVAGVINSNLNQLKKEIRDLSASKEISYSLQSLVAQRSPKQNNENGNRTNSALFSYSPDKFRERIFSPDRLAGRLSSLPKAQFIDFDFPVTSKTPLGFSSQNKISFNSTGLSQRNQASSNSATQSLGKLRFQIESAGRAQQQQGLSSVNKNTSKLIDEVLSKKQNEEVPSFQKLKTNVSALAYKNK